MNGSCRLVKHIHIDKKKMPDNSNLEGTVGKIAGLGLTSLDSNYPNFLQTANLTIENVAGMNLAHFIRSLLN